MSAQPAVLPVTTRCVVDKAAVEMLSEVLENVRAGKVTALVLIAKENGYSRWSAARAYTDADRYNLIGQMQCVIQQLAEAANNDL